MRSSKFVTINENILIEYIYDDSNVIGEPYNILTNTMIGFKCFISADEQNPPRRGFKQTNNTLYNQLYRIDKVQSRYGKVPTLTGQANKVDSDKTSFLQIQNYPTSVPIRYDRIKVHLPVDYTFGEFKGFALRVYTYDFNDKFQYEMSNYYFDMTDVEQNYKLEFSSPLLYLNEKSWGKYLEIHVPSVTKISDQRVQNVTKENTINWNLTGGLGLSKNAPVFIDFHFIESIDTVNGSKFFNLFDKKTVVVPQTPDFENLGVVIDESPQGDFFLIYGTYNGTLAEFENWIDESYYYGNKYYVEFLIDVYEKNVKTKTTTFLLLDDFGEEIEFRPILKFTTTTAVIDVTMKVIDFTDGTTITRKASYGLLQGGGQRMGAEPNDRLGTGNFSGGAGDIAKYARSLSKINLKSAKKPQITSLKTIMLSTTGDDPFGTRPILELVKSPFSVFGDSFFVNNSPGPINFGQLAYQPNNGLITYIYPFDNLITFKILTPDESKEVPYDLSLLTDLKITLKSDNKDLSFGIYKESSYNDLENGKVIFKIPQGSYLEIKKLSSQGFDLFYINGLDEDGNKVIVYSAFFLPFDSVTNINKLEADYRLAEDAARNQLKTTQQPVDITADVRDVILQGENEVKGVNTSTTNQTSRSSGFSGASFNFAPRWMAESQAILLGNSSMDYEKVLPTKALTQMMLDLGLTKKENLSSLVNKFTNKSKGFATAVATEKSDPTDKTFQLILGYFKGLNLKLTPDRLRDLYLQDLRGTSRQYDPGVETEKVGSFTILKDLIAESKGIETFKQNLDAYILSGKTNQRSSKGIGLVESEVKVGEFIPLDKREIEKIKNNQIYDAVPKPGDTTKGNLQSSATSTQNNTSTTSRSRNPGG